MFSQLLTQQVACNYFIDSADYIKSVLNPGFNINFSKNIIIKVKKKVLEKVKKYLTKNVF